MAVEVAAADPRIKALGTIVGFYVDRSLMVAFVGGEDEYNRRIKRAAEAKEKFEKTGQVSCREMAKQLNLRLLGAPPPDPGRLRRKNVRPSHCTKAVLEKLTLCLH